MTTPDDQRKQQRNRFYKLLRVGKSMLDWDEQQFRDCLMRHGAKQQGNKYSATTMNITQLSNAVEEMKDCGFVPRKGGKTIGNRDWRGPRIKKITAIWCALADAGVVHDRSEAGMVKWCATITHVPKLQWASSFSINQCIEGLKRWAEREKVKLLD